MIATVGVEGMQLWVRMRKNGRKCRFVPMTCINVLRWVLQGKKAQGKRNEREAQSILFTNHKVFVIMELHGVMEGRKAH
uniref:Uncharacterized protein n=1 Tax=Oryza punctata TaxID=4537 RepID=A0A0E0L1K4_ORYPU